MPSVAVGFLFHRPSWGAERGGPELHRVPDHVDMERMKVKSRGLGEGHMHTHNLYSHYFSVPRGIF